MADLRVTPASDGARRLTPVASEGRRQQDEHQQQGEGERRHSPPGAEELAVALSGEGAPRCRLDTSRTRTATR